MSCRFRLYFIPQNWIQLNWNENVPIVFTLYYQCFWLYFILLYILLYIPMKKFLIINSIKMIIFVFYFSIKNKKTHSFVLNISVMTLCSCCIYFPIHLKYCFINKNYWIYSQIFLLFRNHKLSFIMVSTTYKTMKILLVRT